MGYVFPVYSVIYLFLKKNKMLLEIYKDEWIENSLKKIHETYDLKKH